ncbi:MAG: molybdenum ABC transporter ATP-binding protein, partial [Pseudomonadales bacterium]|nr:molybdenum ABC transporter ATP-binding protein [Pseudomonadales bacterium]
FGASGCGKTSLLESVAGLRPACRGRVQLGERVWQDSDAKVFLPPERRGVGYVPQDSLLFPRRTVAFNLRSGARRALRNGGGHEGLMDSIVELLELASLLDRDVGTLSGGERQRVALGRALCSAPDLILLDEPLAGLDHPLRQKVLPFLRRVRDELDVPMLLVSHDPIDVQTLCDDLVVLRDGAVIARGAPREVLVDPSVFPIADEGGFENVLPCTTVSSDERRTVVHLGDPPSDLTLSLGLPSPGPRHARFVGIPARDVLVATKQPQEISARNVLAGQVVAVQSMDGFELVHTSLAEGVPEVVVEVTREAVAELGLSPGRAVFLVIKAMSCTLYEEDR